MSVTISKGHQGVQAPSQSSAWQRYFQLGLLTLAAGALYPLLYLRQNFEVTLLQAFGISADQLGELYTILGIVYVITYIPSGWPTVSARAGWWASLWGQWACWACGLRLFLTLALYN
ncbi:hypothetical protein [Lampropedia aestuarii]|uniref:hypothetical protein n=1 Tax=Lampropedia aestuarii TaxID=2562762 RepID=UPI001F0DABDF|nr:hypothetical protein [Lampropedia aestuarii]